MVHGKLIIVAIFLRFTYWLTENEWIFKGYPQATRNSCNSESDWGMFFPPWGTGNQRLRDEAAEEDEDEDGSSRAKWYLIFWKFFPHKTANFFSLLLPVNGRVSGNEGYTGTETLSNWSEAQRHEMVISHGPGCRGRLLNSNVDVGVAVKWKRWNWKCVNQIIREICFLFYKRRREAGGRTGIKVHYKAINSRVIMA